MDYSLPIARWLLQDCATVRWPHITPDVHNWSSHTCFPAHNAIALRIGQMVQTKSNQIHHHKTSATTKNLTTDEALVFSIRTVRVEVTHLARVDAVSWVVAVERFLTNGIHFTEMVFCNGDNHTTTVTTYKADLEARWVKMSDEAAFTGISVDSAEGIFLIRCSIP